MKLETMTAREIDAPRARIWEILADFADVGRWASTIAVSRSVGESPKTGVGAERVCDVPGLGSTHERVLEWDDKSALAYSATAEKLPGFVRNFVGCFDLEDIDRGTRVVQTIRADLIGVKGGLAFVPMRMQMRRAQRAVLRDLDAFATTGSVSSAKAKMREGA